MIRRVIVAVALPALLTACGPTGAPTAPSPAPSFQCTPEAGGSPAPCSLQQYDEMKRKDALYAEAETVFRRFIAENERTTRAGGGTELTPEYLAILGTQKLRQGQLEVLKATKSDGTTIRGDGHFIVSWIHRKPGVSLGGSEVALQSCVDMSRARFYERGKFSSTGPSVVHDVYFGTAEGALRMVVLAVRPVESC